MLVLEKLIILLVMCSEFGFGVKKFFLYVGLLVSCLNIV